MPEAIADNTMTYCPLRLSVHPPSPGSCASIVAEPCLLQTNSLITNQYFLEEN